MAPSCNLERTLAVPPTFGRHRVQPHRPGDIELIGGDRVGSSARALQRLGSEKGYSLVACIGWNAFFVDTEHARSFADADNLDALFDASHLRYAMQTYGGEIFYSSPPSLPWVQLYGKDTDSVESASIKLGIIRWTPWSVLVATVRYYALRPLKRLYIKTKNRRLNSKLHAKP